MMGCKEARELLPLLAAGELEAGAAQPLERHVNICAECRAALKEGHALAGMLAETLAGLEPGAELDASVRKALKASPRRRRWFWPAAVAAAAAVLLAALLIALGPRRPVVCWRAG